MRHHLRTWLIAGLLVVMPLSVTVIILLALFRFLDNLLGPSFTLMLGTEVPGLGIMAGVVLILVVGAMASNIVGRRVVEGFDWLMMRIPFARTIYSATKQLSDVLFQANRMALKQAVLIEWPRKGLYTVGFVTGEIHGQIEDIAGDRVINVFIMTTPNPTTGFLCLVPASQVILLDMSIEDALKLVVSGGLVAPPERGTLSMDPRTPSHAE